MFKNKLLFMMYIGVFISKILNAGKTIKCNLHWKETEWISVQFKLFANSYPDSVIRTLLCRLPVVTSQAIHLSFHLSVHWKSHVRGIFLSPWPNLAHTMYFSYTEPLVKGCTVTSNQVSRSNYEFKVIAELYEKSLSWPFILYPWSNNTHTSLACLWVKSDIEPSF